MTQTEIAGKAGATLSYVNRIAKGREQIVSKALIKMLDELGYGIKLVYDKRDEGLRCSPE